MNYQEADKLRYEIQELIDELIDESVVERNNGTVSKLADSIGLEIYNKLMRLVNEIGGVK